MKSFATVLLAGAFAVTATYAAAQADPHHPAAGAGEAPTPIETAPAEIPGQQQSQKPEFDTACPNSSPMMMEMMAGGEAMPMMQMQMMQMMQGTQLKMMQDMDRMQEQMLMMEQRLEDLTQPEETSP